GAERPDRRWRPGRPRRPHPRRWHLAPLPRAAARGHRAGAGRARREPAGDRRPRLVAGAAGPPGRHDRAASGRHGAICTRPGGHDHRAPDTHIGLRTSMPHWYPRRKPAIGVLASALVVATLIVTGWPAHAQEQPASDYAAIDEYVREQMDGSRIPGVS